MNLPRPPLPMMPISSFELAWVPRTAEAGTIVSPAAVAAVFRKSRRSIVVMEAAPSARNASASRGNVGMGARGHGWMGDERLPCGMRFFVTCAAAVLASSQTISGAGSDAAWLREAKYGVFMHLLPSDAKTLALAQTFDVDALATQLEDVGAAYFVITLGQNSGYFNAPNAAYDKITGYKPGERCSTRDLPADLAAALKAKNIR